MANLKKHIGFGMLAYADGTNSVLVISLKNDPVAFSPCPNIQVPFFAPSFDASKSLPDSVSHVDVQSFATINPPVQSSASVSVSYSSHTGEITITFATPPLAGTFNGSFFSEIIVTGQLEYD